MLRRARSVEIAEPLLGESDAGGTLKPPVSSSRSSLEVDEEEVNGIEKRAMVADQIDLER